MKKKTFGRFRMECQEMFTAFSEHSTMSDLRVWDSFPGDILKERQCWYCVVRLTDTCQMMITYDYDEVDDKPYVCWYDYTFPTHGTISYSHWEFQTLEEAMLFCCHEPHQNYQSYMRDQYILYRETKNKYGGFSWQCYRDCSLLLILERIKNDKDIPTGDWEIRKTNEFNKWGKGETMYVVHIDNGKETGHPFGVIYDKPTPAYIYEEY